MKRHIFQLFLLLVFALAIRLSFFSGYVLGDDATHVLYAERILNHDYPLIFKHTVFAVRPIILYLIAASIYLLGWNEFSLIFPILLASLLSGILVYLAANRLHGPLAALLASLIYYSFALDAVHATTITNDILLSAFVWTGGLLLLFSIEKRKTFHWFLLLFFSGFFTGIAIAVKINATLMFFVFNGLLFIFLLNDNRQRSIIAAHSTVRSMFEMTTAARRVEKPEV